MKIIQPMVVEFEKEVIVKKRYVFVVDGGDCNTCALDGGPECSYVLCTGGNYKEMEND